MKKTLLTLSVFMAQFLVVASAMASNHGAAESNKFSAIIGLGFAAAIAIGVAAFGGAIAQGKAASSALEGIARNPGAQGKIFVPMIIGLALIESLVIYGLLIAFSLTESIEALLGA
jgi:F-type H+-transporting ATPase subunit c